MSATTGLVRRWAPASLAALLLLAACGAAPAATPRPSAVHLSTPVAARKAARWQHVVIVVEENHAYGSIIGSPSAPYFTRLARSGANFVRYFAITHPSQPNYLALFSGSTQHVDGDSCPHDLTADNLGHQLLAARRTFVGYSENLPRPGSQACTSGAYARKHAPWVDFTDLPSSVNQPLTHFPSDYARLPDVSFVIPNLDHDMHDGTISQADTWLHTQLGSYARWAPSHHSLLIITWDEDDDTPRNRIPTFAVGAGVHAGTSTQRVTHYSLLRTLEAAFGLPALLEARHAHGIAALLH